MMLLVVEVLYDSKQCPDYDTDMAIGHSMSTQLYDDCPLTELVSVPKQRTNYLVLSIV
jgi:hypothetical protein